MSNLRARAKKKMPADPVFSPAGDKLTSVPYLGLALLAQRHGQKT
jgi:hypothetical protein